ncbi:MAG: hypothetical protein WCI59_12370 [Betaproteobacteria bacterium]
MPEEGAVRPVANKPARQRALSTIRGTTVNRLLDEAQGHIG